MAWFSRISRPEKKLASVLRMYDSSLKHLRTIAFSLPRFIQNNHCNNNLLSPRLCVIPIIRKQSHFLSCTRVLQRDSNRSFVQRGKQWTCFFRLFHTNETKAAKLSTNIKGSPNKNTSGLIYVVAIFIFMLGGAYAGVPLYKVFCQATGLGGQAIREENSAKIESMQKVDRQIRVLFNADVASSMRWNFKPQQNEVTVLPGETALAFYTAKNPTDKPIIGISTYNVLPFDAGQYFNKIQCFCFEEQRLNPKEQVDMPVFFYIDPEFAEDPKLEHVDTITLSYTFFEAVDGLSLPLPGYPQPHDPLPPRAVQ